MYAHTHVHIYTYIYLYLKNNNPTQISNIHDNEKESINELANDHRVTIKEADKGGTIVLISTLDYTNNCENLLLDTTNYKIVQQKTPRVHE